MRKIIPMILKKDPDDFLKRSVQIFQTFDILEIQ